jgi:hypothetical protein
MAGFYYSDSARTQEKRRTLRDYQAGELWYSRARHGVLASEATMRDSPEIILRVLRAIIAGWESVYAEHDKSIPLIASFGEPAVPADLIRFDLDMQRDFVRSLGRRFGEFDDGQWLAH